ncbi:MAG: VOC family protein [Myxococcota bacterium]
MDARLNVITLGVADLARARAFYLTGLGWRASSASNDHVTFIDVGGLVLALFPREHLAADAHLDPAGSGFGGITLAQNVGSKAAVDAVLAAAVAAGGTLLKAAEDVFWGGYSGYFADPDGHPWEVAWNPLWPLDASGRVQLPA